MAPGPRSDERDPAHLQFVSGPVGQRYLRITINLLGDRRAMAALLAHELHHAREVATHPDVIDQESMEQDAEKKLVPRFSMTPQDVRFLKSLRIATEDME